jgi:hypothetical protein
MVSFVSRLLYTASKHCMSAPRSRTQGGCNFRDQGYTMTALDLFLSLIFMLLIVIWIFGRYQREE